eukprot:TRINITY_DN5366_c0_g1_i5.p1 TRINITY_DN5366_c0_g1~~TRINITY_DN5366_c0_g1_i5.p1  ORF type:complete len:354 (-),score=84.10 TRINITY_DN5366_c0_g1_i5:120-1181(-)
MEDLPSILTSITNGRYDSFNTKTLSALIKYITTPPNSGIEQKLISEQSLSKCILRKKGLSLLFKTIQDPLDSKQRKLAAKLLCMLACENEEAQASICSHSGFCQLSDKICINPVPESVKAQLREKPEIIREIKEIKTEEIKGRAKGLLYWCYPPYNSAEDDFPDPLSHLIGFYTFSRERAIKKSASKYTKSVQAKCSSSCLTYAAPQGEKSPVEVQPLSVELRLSLTQDWRQTARLSRSALENPEAGEKFSSDHLESVVEEVNMDKELSIKTKRELVEELKEDKVVHSQRSKLRSNAKKLQTTIFSITQTLPSNKLRPKEASSKKPKVCATTKSSSRPAPFELKTSLRKKQLS